jgi:hypothetical protein
MDERGLRPGIDFDAIVAHERAVIECMRELRVYGCRVPQDVSILGMGDLEGGRYISPPLTTLRVSPYDMGWHGVKVLMRMLAGESVPNAVELPTQVMIRQSCGCPETVVQHAVSDGVGRPGKLRKGVSTLLESRTAKATLAHEIAGLIGESVKNLTIDHITLLVDAFMTSLDESASADNRPFLAVLENILQQVSVDEDGLIWQEAISILRRCLLPYVNTRVQQRAEDLWQQARIMAASLALRAQAYQVFQADQQVQQLRSIGAALLTSFDVQKLMAVLADGLPKLGVAGCYIALYEDPQTNRSPLPVSEWSRLILAYNEEQGSIELAPGGLRFQSQQLIPNDLLLDGEYSLVVEPLTFMNDQLGFVVFNVSRKSLRDGSV